MIAIPSVFVSYGLLTILQAVASRIAREGATPSNDPAAVAPRLHKGWLIVSLLLVAVGIPASVWFTIQIWDWVR